jgi:hypothetical protein
MQILMSLLICTCIVSGSIERNPADCKTSTAADAVDMRGVSSVSATLSGLFNSNRRGMSVVIR